MKDRIQFNPQEQQQQAGEQQALQSAPLEFPNVEAMLRHDALHTPVPPSIGCRIEQSLAQTPAPPRPWWRRLFGGPS
jgi:hypothetical protein